MNKYIEKLRDSAHEATSSGVAKYSLAVDPFIVIRMINLIDELTHSLELALHKKKCMCVGRGDNVVICATCDAKELLRSAKACV